MPHGRIVFSNGHEWIFSNCELFIPCQNADHWTPDELGRHVLDMLGRINALTEWMTPWEEAKYQGLAEGDTIEDIEAWVHQQKRWRETREQAREHIPRLRRELQAHYAKTFLKIGRRDGFHCQQCRTTHDMDIDHIISLINGGTNDLNNLQLLCDSCNSSKSDRD